MTIFVNFFFKCQVFGNFLHSNGNFTETDQVPDLSHLGPICLNLEASLTTAMCRQLAFCSGFKLASPFRRAACFDGCHRLSHWLWSCHLYFHVIIVQCKNFKVLPYRCQVYYDAYMIYLLKITIKMFILRNLLSVDMNKVYLI